ncbi:hypothetical protein [Anaeromyxobacter oryzae]|uniref:HEAT repeat domain-containing protein n=1 Tax=Anaeromyxobacter oryzae TaxID=2918170 RepID=A0ABN6MQH0_9BACT|nr:hypothetical protein [Anaeromyxobacter oryzae]BDG02167.1 hypothetical protein AMOR_11630 [Anaeromyxobacter oryzae]
MASRTLPSGGGPPPRRVLTTPAAAAAVLLAALLLAPVLLPRPEAPERAAPPVERAPSAPSGAAEGASATTEAPRAALPAPSPAPASGWEEDAWYVLDALEALATGRRAGAFAEARAEAIRGDLALFPPGAAELRALLRGGLRERALALVAAAARPPDDEDVLELALRAFDPADPLVVRLLGAELVAALPPERVALHDDALVRAFEAEPDPLVLATALPGLERLDAVPLARIFRTQLVHAAPEMQPVLLRLAASRVGAEALEQLEAATPGLALEAP